MGELISLERVLCLPAPDITALLEGQNIVAIPKVAVQRGWTFALYPCDLLTDSLPVQKQYHSYAHTSAQAALTSLNTSTVEIEAWARCELSTMIHDEELLEALSCSTVWTKAALQEALNQRQHIFLAYLQVYKLAQPVSVSANSVTSDKYGKFISLSSLPLENYPSPSIKVTELIPVLDEAVFIQRKQRLERGEKPLHHELIKLEEAIASLANTNHAANRIRQEIRDILGWHTIEITISKSSVDLDWISKINALGTATTGGNYEKGTAFEQVVHKSLSFLGFELDSSAKGGAGGIDLYCTKPYPLIGECKAGQTIPGNTVYELNKLGSVHLTKQFFDTVNKLIIGPGKPTTQLQQSAQQFGISIINPMTLQKLVELQATYPNSIDLIELKEYLRPGQIDDKIEEYITKVLQKIRLRANIVQAVKQLSEMEPERRQFEVSEVRVQYNILFCKLNGNTLDNEIVHELLIELSSPLAGYLGRLRGTSLQSDRFYFLRDMPEVDLSQS